MCDCIALRWVAPCCTYLTGELGQTHHGRRAEAKPERPQTLSAEHKTSGKRGTGKGEPLYDVWSYHYQIPSYKYPYSSIHHCFCHHTMFSWLSE